MTSMNKTMRADGTVVTELEGFPEAVMQGILHANRAIQFCEAEVEKLRRDILAWDAYRQKQWRDAEVWLNEHGLTHRDQEGVKNIVEIDFFKMKAVLLTKL